MKHLFVILLFCFLAIVPDLKTSKSWRPIIIEAHYPLDIITEINRLFDKDSPTISGFEGIFPFVIVRPGADKYLINHESIHFQQQIDCHIIPYYLFYVYFYIKNRINGKNHIDAYFYIPFEIEAYGNEYDLNYLKNRKRKKCLDYFNLTFINK